MVVALAHGERDVVGLHVVLEIDERLAARARDAPQGLVCLLGPIVLDGAERRRRGAAAEVGEKRRSLRRALGEGLGQRRRAHRGAGERQGVFGREKGAVRLAPARLAAALAGQMNARAVAAAHQQRVDVESPTPSLLLDLTTREPAPARGRNHRRAAPRVDHFRDFDARSPPAPAPCATPLREP